MHKHKCCHAACDDTAHKQMQVFKTPQPVDGLAADWMVNLQIEHRNCRAACQAACQANKHKPAWLAAELRCCNRQPRTRDASYAAAAAAQDIREAQQSKPPRAAGTAGKLSCTPPSQSQRRLSSHRRAGHAGTEQAEDGRSGQPEHTMTQELGKSSAHTAYEGMPAANACGQQKIIGQRVIQAS